MKWTKAKFNHETTGFWPNVWEQHQRRHRQLLVTFHVPEEDAAVDETQAAFESNLTCGKAILMTFVDKGELEGWLVVENIQRVHEVLSVVFGEGWQNWSGSGLRRDHGGGAEAIKGRVEFPHWRKKAVQHGWWGEERACGQNHSSNSFPRHTHPLIAPLIGAIHLCTPL